MSAQELVFGQNEVLKLDDARGAVANVRSDDVRLTRHDTPNECMVKAGNTIALDGKRADSVAAFPPTLLELYRQDPVAVRMGIERQAHRARNKKISTFFARFLR
jgi:hypothetical protein